MGASTRSTSVHAFAISYPTVPCPAMMCRWSNGGTMTSPSASAISSARAFRSTEVVPSNSTSAPSRFAPSTFTFGAVVGMTTTTRTPRSLPASATACAWFPEEYVMIPPDT
jgi:hypothetical protein